MKQALLSLALAAICVTNAAAFGTRTVQGDITANTRWTADSQTLLKGYVYVTAGVTLTVDSGSIIRGDKNTKGSLIIEKGAKLIAIGSKTAPIVFTSNQPAGSRFDGDWGGVILCGTAPVNWNGNDAIVEGGPRSHYGGTNVGDNSGTLKYVRIEFAGIAFSPNNEINGLTLCGVGNGTQIDHIQVSYSGDDSYEWFGGSVNSKYLIAFRGHDDDFDNDNGWTGKVQFGVSLRDPLDADQSGSKAYESDSYQPGLTFAGTGGDTSQATRPVFCNMTNVGPLNSPTATNYDNQYVAGVHLRRGTEMSLINSIVMGFPCGILFDESVSTVGSTTANIANGGIQIRSTIIAGNATTSSPTGNKDLFYVINGARSITPTNAMADTTTNNPFAPFSGPYSFFTNPAFGNKIYSSATNGVKLFQPFDLNNPNFVPTTVSPVAYNTKGNGSATTGSFNPNNPINYDTTGGYANYNVPLVPPSFNNKAADAFFDKVNYVGAFAGTQTTSDNWTAGWAVWTPTTTDYDSKVNTYGGIPQAVSNLTNLIQKIKVVPNPMSGNGALLLDLNAKTTLKISVIDLTGRTVLEVFNGTKNAGVSQVAFDASALSNGMYMMQVTTENGARMVKFNVVK